MTTKYIIKNPVMNEYYGECGTDLYFTSDISMAYRFIDEIEAINVLKIIEKENGEDEKIMSIEKIYIIN